MSYSSVYLLANAVRRAPDSNMVAVASDAIIEAFSHHAYVPSPGSGESWDTESIRDECYDIGEIVYQKFGMNGLREIYGNLRSVRGGVAARFLERYWDGVGDGAWRG